jgi:hypothetical protein
MPCFMERYAFESGFFPGLVGLVGDRCCCEHFLEAPTEHVAVRPGSHPVLGERIAQPGP